MAVQGARDRNYLRTPCLKVCCKPKLFLIPFLLAFFLLHNKKNLVDFLPRCGALSGVLKSKEPGAVAPLKPPIAVREAVNLLLLFEPSGYTAQYQYFSIIIMIIIILIL